MPKAMLKRADGSAYLLEVIPIPGDMPLEGSEKLAPNDLVDGIAVKDWPVGVHSVTRVEFDSAHTPEIET
jgi:hypothetical protein